MRISDWSSDVCSSDLLGIASTIGVAMGGVSVDRLGRRDLRWYLWLPAAALSVATPLYAIGLLQADWRMTTLILTFASISFFAFLPTTTASTLPLVEPRMRASTAAIHNPGRSEESRVGKECVGTCSSRWSPYH